MEKLPMCRICLVEDVRMYVVVNKNLHELYEKLTGVPFVTKDRRPMLACFFCCTKLKQCWRFLRKCLEAEELFAQMMNEDYEPDPLINPGHLEFFNGLSNSQIVHISIVDGGQTESDAIKKELQEEEHQTDELQLDNVDNSYSDVEDTPALHAESDSGDVPLMEIKTEVEDEQESIEAPVAKKPQLDTRRPQPKDTISVEQTKTENTRKLSCVSKIIQKTQNLMCKRVPKLKEPFSKTQHAVNSRVNNTALGTSSRNNSDKDDIECNISKKGVDSDDINRYRRAFVTEKRFICDICQRSFSKKSNLTRHIRTHIGEKLFKCDICQRSFIQKSNLVKHTLKHTGEKPFKCDVCQRSFSQKCTLVYHARIHTLEKPFKCDICLRGFSKKLHLTRHIRVHTSKEPFKCDICQRCFHCKQHLVSHTYTHTGEKPFKCEVCQRSFNQKSSLVYHARTHTGEKPFQCDICQRGFSQKSTLLYHARTHTGEKPFKCDLCQRSFNRKEHLVKHTHTHTGEKPFKCNICQRSFSQKRSLVSHARIHTGEKPFKCDMST